MKKKSRDYRVIKRRTNNNLKWLSIQMPDHINQLLDFLNGIDYSQIFGIPKERHGKTECNTNTQIN